MRYLRVLFGFDKLVKKLFAVMEDSANINGLSGY